MSQTIDLLKLRRTHYNLVRKSPLSEDQILDLIGEALRQTPTAFNRRRAGLLYFSASTMTVLGDGLSCAGGRRAEGTIPGDGRENRPFCQKLRHRPLFYP